AFMAFRLNDWLVQIGRVIATTQGRKLGAGLLGWRGRLDTNARAEKRWVAVRYFAHFQNVAPIAHNRLRNDLSHFEKAHMAIVRHGRAILADLVKGENIGEAFEGVLIDQDALEGLIAAHFRVIDVAPDL